MIHQSIVDIEITIKNAYHQADKLHQLSNGEQKLNPT